MRGKILLISFIGLCILCLAALGTSYAQQKKVGGGDIKYQAAGSSGPVTFSHAVHSEKAKLKCTDCHTKIFKMKKGEFKQPKAEHGSGKGCATCHNGQKTFGMTSDADCAKCHKK